MASKNDEMNGAAIGLALLGAGLIFMAVIIFFLLALFTAFLSVVALCALFKPVRLGKYTLDPEIARAFLLRGVAGWFLFPFAVICIAPAFDIQIYDSYIIYLMMTGYMIGSVGIEFILEKIRDANEEADEEASTQMPIIPERQLPRPEPKPFQFASWDDEEDR